MTTPRLILNTFLLLILTACGTAPEPVDVTTVAAVTSTPAAPTSTPLPTLTPTPAISPEEVLRQADRQMIDGYWAEARASYQTLAQRGDVLPEVAGEAALGAGRAALYDGAFTEAAALLTDFTESFPRDSQIAQAHLMRGDARMGLAEWEAAAADYQRYLDLRPGIIDSYVYERLGDAQLAAGAAPAALQSYEAATDAPRSLVPLLALRKKVAQIYLSGGGTAQAVAQYDAILDVAQNAPYRAAIQFAAGRALLEGGGSSDTVAEGLRRLGRVFSDHPDTPEALEALRLLLANGRDPDPYQAGRVYAFNGDYQNAIIAFNRYSDTESLIDIPADFYLALGRAYREVGNYQAASVAFRTVPPGDPAYGEALLEQGRSLRLAGDLDGAINFYQNLANDNPNLTETAAEALWRAGVLYDETGQDSLAREVFLELAQRYPQSAWAREGFAVAGATALEAGDTDAAEAFYADLAERAAGTERAEALLQAARLAQARDDTEAAQTALRGAIAAAPDSFYSARARDLLEGVEPFAPPVDYRFQFDDAVLVAEAEDWLRQTFNIEQTGALWLLPPALQQDARLIRGQELWETGAFAAAEDEFFEVINAYADDALPSYQLSLFMRGVGAYYPSVVAAANVLIAANVSTLDAPLYIARMCYPAYYREVVLSAAERHNLDPLLLYSLMRQESLFSTYATAAAGEKGLTQVIPGTGDYIAGELDFPDYQHADLFKPYAGVEFGAFYLGEQLTAADGAVFAALGAYNAGPSRALNWLEVSGRDFDRFLDAITVENTRTYVQRIYSNYHIYRYIYGVPG